MHTSAMTMTTLLVQQILGIPTTLIILTQDLVLSIMYNHKSLCNLNEINESSSRELFFVSFMKRQAMQ